MSTCPNIEPLMTDALFGELAEEDRRRLNAHLETCADCAEEFKALQATLQFTAERERAEPPAAFWESYEYRLAQRMEREAQLRAPTLRERLDRWWDALAASMTGPMWAMQGALAALLLLVGFWWGQASTLDDLGLQPVDPTVADGDTEERRNPLALTDDGRAPLSSLLLADAPLESEQGSVHPAIAGVEDITYDMTSGTVEIRYNTVNDIVLRGTPDDPRIQRLLQTALLDESNPASRLHAVKTLESAAVAPDSQVVSALTYLARAETDDNLRFRAVRALRALHQNAPLNDRARDVLINVLLNDTDAALRIEALQALTEGGVTGEEATGYLYEARNDSNSYIRYQATEALRTIGASSTTDDLWLPDDTQ